MYFSFKPTNIQVSSLFTILLLQEFIRIVNVKARVILSAPILMNVMRHVHRMQLESTRSANVATHPNIMTQKILFAEVLLDDHARLPPLELDHTVCA